MREIVIDTETTGLEPADGHRVVEIGAIELFNHVPTGRVFHSYINPERDMPADALQVHGLTTAFLQDQPVFAEVVDAFLQFLASDGEANPAPARLVIHNAAFDLAFINHELRRAGRPVLDGEHVDTLLLARQRFPGRIQQPGCAVPALQRRCHRAHPARRAAGRRAARRGLSVADGRPPARSRAGSPGRRCGRHAGARAHRPAGPAACAEPGGARRARGLPRQAQQSDLARLRPAIGRRAAAGLGPEPAGPLQTAEPTGETHGQDQGGETDRRDRRRRDDPDHLADDQGAADLSASRSRDPVLRPSHREPRRHRRSHHDRGRRGDQAAQCRRQMRHHHARRGARAGVRPEADVALAQRHDPQHPGRHGVPRADHLQQRAAPGARLDPADRDRPPRLRRPVPRDRLQGAGRRHAHHDLHARGRLQAAAVRDLPLSGRRRRARHVQPRQFDPRLRQGLHELRADAQLPALSLDQEHHPEGLRRPLQGPVRGGVRGRVRGKIRRAGPDLRAPPDRRHGRRGDEVERRVRLGVQELRRRRAERHGGPGLRLARPDDLGADDAGRQDDRGGGGARHGDPPLSPAPAGQADLDQPDRLDLRLDPRAHLPRQDRRHARGRGSSRARSSGSASRRSRAAA